MAGLEQWIVEEAGVAARRLVAAISATGLVMERPGFGQKMVPRPGSVLASPFPGHYDPDPDYFFHWFRDSAIAIDALRVALAEGLMGDVARARFREFVEFSLALRNLDGRDFLRKAGDFRARVQPSFLQFVRPDAEIAAIRNEAILGDVRVNPDGTLDFIHWSRPQSDGPAQRCIALLRWCRVPGLDANLHAAMRDLIQMDLAFSLSQAQQPCFDIWEEREGLHYHTLLVHLAALSDGAGWLESQAETARACRAAADEIAARLDDLWDADAGYYRAHDGGDGPSSHALDFAVILAVLHAGRMAGRHSVLDPRAQATLAALEELFEKDYAINRNRPADRGPAMGRYAGDVYYGGGAYYFMTLGAAEFYFRLASALQDGAELPITEENLRFRQRLADAEGAGADRSLAALAFSRGDAIMRMVQAYTPASGELSEQFDQSTGAQTSARDLTWSYAAFITAAASRRQACRAMRAADPANPPAGRA